MIILLLVKSNKCEQLNCNGADVVLCERALFTPACGRNRWRRVRSVCGVHVRRPGIDGWCQPLPAPLRSKPLGSDHHRFVRTGNRPRFCVVVTLKDLGLRICSGLMGATVHFSVSFILWYKSSVAHIK